MPDHPKKNLTITMIYPALHLLKFKSSKLSVKRKARQATVKIKQDWFICLYEKKGYQMLCLDQNV